MSFDQVWGYIYIHGFGYHGNYHIGGSNIIIRVSYLITLSIEADVEVDQQHRNS